MIYSVEEIDRGTIAEGYDELNELERGFEDMREEMERESKKYEKMAEHGFGYWLDNCGDDVWYCEHCLQPDCGKRMAKRKNN